MLRIPITRGWDKSINCPLTLIYLANVSSMFPPRFLLCKGTYNNSIRARHCIRILFGKRIFYGVSFSLFTLLGKKKAQKFAG